MSKQPLVVTAIDTDAGKTVVSALVAKALNTDYWKPVQAGGLDHSDSMEVDRLTGGSLKIWPEAFRLNTPASPHLAAEIDGIEIQPEQLVIPETENQLLIEGAGGLMVPISEKFTLLDWFKMINPKILVVTKHYLGSINHTLCTLEVMKQHGLQVEGLIVNGDAHEPSERAFAKIAGVKVLAHVPLAPQLNTTWINNTAAELAPKLSFLCPR